MEAAVAAHTPAWSGRRWRVATERAAARISPWQLSSCSAEASGPVALRPHCGPHGAWTAEGCGLARARPTTAASESTTKVGGSKLGCEFRRTHVRQMSQFVSSSVAVGPSSKVGLGVRMYTHINTVSPPHPPPRARDVRIEPRVYTSCMHTSLVIAHPRACTIQTHMSKCMGKAKGGKISFAYAKHAYPAHRLHA